MTSASLCFSGARGTAAEPARGEPNASRGALPTAALAEGRRAPQSRRAMTPRALESPGPARALRARVTGALRGAWPWALVAVLAWWAFGGLTAGGPPEGARVPALEVALDDGRTFSLDAQRGRVVVVNFWGTYCPPCRAEAPVLARAAALLRATGDVLIGVAVDPAPLADVARFARGLGMSYPIAVIPPGPLAPFRVTQVPTTVVVDRRGLVARTLVGALDDDRLARAIADARRAAP